MRRHAIAFAVHASDEFHRWWVTCDDALQETIATYVGLLEAVGPNLGRPYADTSRIWRTTAVAKPFRDLVDALPTPRRERIEAQTQELFQEYELLKALRQDRRVTQKQLAALMGIRQSSVSKIENQDDMRLSTLRKYVEALGGRLEVRVRFSDRDVRLDPLRGP